MPLSVPYRFCLNFIDNTLLIEDRAINKVIYTISDLEKRQTEYGN